MLKTELLEIIANGENSGIGFKRDDSSPEQAEKLARELVAFANFRGGRLLIGVDDNGAVSGIQRTNMPGSGRESMQTRTGSASACRGA